MAEPGTMSAVADDYIERSCALDPIKATALGVPGHDDRLTDYSPAGVEERVALDRDTLVHLASTDRPAPTTSAAVRRFMTERLGVALAMADANEHLRAVRNIASPVQAIRQVFDLMPHESVDDWEIIAARIERVPTALVGLRIALDEGRVRQIVSARRQAIEAGEQCAVWGGERDAAPFFETLVRSVGPRRGLVAAHCARGSTRHPCARPRPTARWARWLRDVYAPAADETDAVGAERYRLFALASLGADIDLDETYQWGWDELFRIEDEMRGECGRIGAAATTSAPTIDWLETESDLVIEGEDNLRALAPAVDGLAPSTRWTACTSTSPIP